MSKDLYCYFPKVFRKQVSHPTLKVNDYRNIPIFVDGNGHIHNKSMHRKAIVAGSHVHK